MEKLLIEWDEKSIEIKNLVYKFREYLADNPVPKSIRDGLKSFDRSLAEYVQAVELNDIEKIIQSVQMVAVYGQTIGQAMPKFKEASENVKTLGENILQASIELRSIVENSPLEYKPIDKVEEGEKIIGLHSFQTLKKNLKLLADDYDRHEQRVNKFLNETEIKIEKISRSSESLETSIQNEINKFSDLYESSLAELEDKKSQIDKILGHVSGRAIAGDFEKSAEEERYMANWLRFAALICMFLIVSIVAYSFWETTSSNFNWGNSLFRIVLAFILSIPAAYLARESAKHREQQYAHQQTSLDLKTIAPYIASLPEDEQHKIKIEIASRLFAAKNFSRVSENVYPINAHEIMMEIIKKLDFKGNDPKA